MKLLFSWSLYNAKQMDYENILKELRETFKDNKPDLLLNNPEYLLFCATNKANWQNEMVELVNRLKKFINARIQSLRDGGSDAHVVYRFSFLDMESAFFQFPPDLEDDD